MRTAIRTIAAVLVVGHGLLHLLGAAKGLGWAQVSQLRAPISSGMGVLWLVAAALVIATGVLLGSGARSWWIVGGAAVVASQGMIFTAWSDAGAGTAANVVLLAAVGYWYASRGPQSYRAEYQRLVAAALAEPVPTEVVTEADLAHLPPLVAAYLRRSGAVGQPRVTSFRARLHGRIRAGASKPWMSFTAGQVTTFSPQSGRLFLMDATMFGLPIDVLHVFLGPSATMRVKACSIVPIVNAAGPEMDQGETVTLFNDLCLLAPAALIDAPVTWQDVDESHVRGAYTYGGNTVTAVLAFDAEHQLVDFVSEDRLRASADGKNFVRQRWSTPVQGYRAIGPRRISDTAQARWHAPQPEGEFAYLDVRVDRIDYNVAGAGRSAAASSVPA